MEWCRFRLEWYRSLALYTERSSHFAHDRSWHHFARVLQTQAEPGPSHSGFNRYNCAIGVARLYLTRRSTGPTRLGHSSGGRRRDPLCRDLGGPRLLVPTEACEAAYGDTTGAWQLDLPERPEEIAPKIDREGQSNKMFTETVCHTQAPDPWIHEHESPLTLESRLISVKLRSVLVPLASDTYEPTQREWTQSLRSRKLTLFQLAQSPEFLFEVRRMRLVRLYRQRPL